MNTGGSPAGLSAFCHRGRPWRGPKNYRTYEKELDSRKRREKYPGPTMRDDIQIYRYAGKHDE